MSSLGDEVRSAAVVAKASTKAVTRSALMGTIPIIEFGLLIVFSMVVASIPLKLIRRFKNV